MTEEKIIIHNVSVKDCEYFRWFDSKCSLVNCPHGGHPSCESVINCQYKRLAEQLEQKTIECEKYEQALDEIKSMCDKTCQICQIFRKCDKEFSTCKNARIINVINKAKEDNNDK